MSHEHFQVVVNTFAFIGFLCTFWSVAVVIALVISNRKESLGND